MIDSRIQHRWRRCVLVLLWGILPCLSSGADYYLYLSGAPSQPVDLAAFAGYLRDSAAQFTFTEIREKPPFAFRPLATAEQPFSRNEDAYWVYFELQNDSADSLYLLVRSEFRLDYFDLYTPFQVLRQAGFLVAVQRLAYPDNYRCLPVELGPHEQRSFYLRLKQDCFPVEEGKLWLSTYAQEEAWREADTIEHLGIFNYYFAFFAGMGLLLFLVVILFVYHPREKALVYYALYLMLVILFYLRNFEDWHNGMVVVFKYVRNWHYPLEVMLSYTSYIAYLFFVLHLLDLDANNPRLALGLRALARGFSTLLVVNLLAMYFNGQGTGMTMLEYVRIFFFIIAIPGLILLVSRLRNFLTFVVLFGTLVMLLGALLPAIGYWFDGQVERVSHTAWGRIYFDGWSYFFYDFKLGALLESFCFFIGLNYKISRRMRPGLFVNDPAPGETSVSEDAPWPETDFLREVLALCRARLADESFGPQELADALHLSHAHMHRKLKEQTGLNATELLRDLRLQQAKELLLTTDWRVGDIAHAVGFSDPAYFTRVFRQATGKSPRAFRQQGTGKS